MAHPVGLHGITQNQRDAGKTAHKSALYESMAFGADCPQTDVKVGVATDG